jgi:hypothetical protein
MLRHRDAAKLFTGGGACRYIRRAWLNPESTNRPSHYGRCFGFMHDPSYYWRKPNGSPGFLGVLAPSITGVVPPVFVNWRAPSPP